jgi:hypothetical protein
VACQVLLLLLLLLSLPLLQPQHSCWWLPLQLAANLSRSNHLACPVQLLLLPALQQLHHSCCWLQSQLAANLS